MADVGIVIGAGGEIGGACALALAPSHRTVLCVDRDADAAEDTAANIREAGRSAITLIVDAEESGFAAAVTHAAAELGETNTAVHAIAFEEHISAKAISVESIQRSFTLGPLAAFSLFRELLLGGGLARGAGFTVIGSLHASHAFTNALGYNLAQAALTQLVATLAHEWVADGVRVNAVIPGWTRTRGETALYGEDFLNATASLLPMGRFGAASEIAAAVEYLASSRAAYISGTSITVDGALGVSLAQLPGGQG